MRAHLVLLVSFALLSTIVFMPSPASAAEDWVQMDDMPFQTIAFSTAHLPDGIVFFNGGQKEGANGNSDETWLYDTSSDTWESKAPSPLALAGASAVYMPDGCVYVFCGKDSNGQWDHGVLVYDVAEDSWTELPFVMDLGFFREVAAIDDTRILIAGGLVSHPIIPTDQCLIYDIRYNGIYGADPLPRPISLGSMVRVDDSLYYIGGFDAMVIEIGFNVLRYDIRTGNWEDYGVMSFPSIGGKAVLAADGLIYIFGSIYEPDNYMMALDLRDCSLQPCPAIPMKSASGGIASANGMVFAFGGENDNMVSREVYSLTLYEKDAWLGSAEAGPGTSVRVYADFEATSFENQGMTATAYLVKDGTTFGSCQMVAVDNGTASGLLEVPEDLEPGSYEVLITDVDTGVGIAGLVQFDALSLTVTDAPTPSESLTDMQEELSQLRDELEDTRAELAEVKESADGKMEAWVGYAILVLATAAVVLLALQMVRKR